MGSVALNVKPMRHLPSVLETEETESKKAKAALVPKTCCTVCNCKFNALVAAIACLERFHASITCQKIKLT